MVGVRVTVAAGGLHPLEACKAWYLRTEEERPWHEVQAATTTVDGQTPKMHALRNAVDRVAAQQHDDVPGQTAYANCGRKPTITPEQIQEAVRFVRAWRHKRFCTCRYIINELRLPIKRRQLAKILNDHGFFWKRIPRTLRLTAPELAKRKVWVDRYHAHSAAWWAANTNLVLDGVTLTTAPRSLTGQQKHAAQRIGHMWLQKGETVDPEMHTFNRYGVQLGTKVPLWGGFTGGGKFTLRLWTPRSKMTKPEWEAHVPALKRAVDAAETRGSERVTQKAKVWHDNEKFLLCPATYRQHELVQVRFPPNSGDLNPIETVWARLRRDLAEREQEDLTAGRTITTSQFKQRAAQILNSYGVAAPGQTHSFLQKLVRGMPKRLAKCKANKYGRCGK